MDDEAVLERPAFGAVVQFQNLGRRIAPGLLGKPLQMVAGDLLCRQTGRQQGFYRVYAKQLFGQVVGRRLGGGRFQGFEEGAAFAAFKQGLEVLGAIRTETFVDRILDAFHSLLGRLTGYGMQCIARRDLHPELSKAFDGRVDQHCHVAFLGGEIVLKPLPDARFFFL